MNKIMTTSEPQIIRETSYGYSLIRIQDEMFCSRQIQCIGEINEDLTNSLCMQLAYLHERDPTEDITMYINSHGGEVSGGLAIYDVMKAIQCPVRTICVDMAASMAPSCSFPELSVTCCLMPEL